MNLFFYLAALTAKLCRQPLNITVRFWRHEGARRGGIMVSEHTTLRSATRALRYLRTTPKKAYQHGFYYLSLEATAECFNAPLVRSGTDHQQTDIEEEIVRVKQQDGVLPRVPEAPDHGPEASGARAAAPDEAQAAAGRGEVLPDHARPVSLADLGRR